MTLYNPMQLAKKKVPFKTIKGLFLEYKPTASQDIEPSINAQYAINAI